MNPQEAHIFVVDDEPSIGTAVQRALETSGMHVSVFSSARDCLAGLLRQTCDVLVTDFRMDGMDGMSLLREVKCRFPWVRTIMITGYGDIPLAVAATKAGAVAFIEKPPDRQELLAAIERVLENAVQPEPSLRRGLSDTEAEVLHHILDGQTNKEIARSLNRSTRTIEVHRRNIMRKFSANNIAQLIQRAIALGFGKDDRGHQDSLNA
jgi:two-component system, LuxR family, response regulator FixJ